MALRDRKPAGSEAPATQTAQAGKFEADEGGTVVADKPVATAPEAPAIDAGNSTTLAAASAAQEASTAIAKAAATSLATAKEITKRLSGLREKLNPAQFEYGTFPSLVGSNGQIMDADKKLLGSWVRLHVMSFNDKYVISPGDDTDEAKEAVRYSLDGKTLIGSGESVDGYLKQLKESEGYDDASVKHYLDLYGVLIESEKPSEHDRKIVAVSLSPQSKKSWMSYMANTEMAVGMGWQTGENAEVVLVRANVKSKGNKTFTLLNVTDK